MKINVVGVDPSYKNFALVKSILNLSTKKIKIYDTIIIQTEKQNIKGVRANSDHLRRCRLLWEGLQNFNVNDCSFAIAEIPHGSQGAASGRALGICYMLMATLPIPLIEVTANEVKLASVGIKKATKREMIEWGVKAHPEANWKTMKRKGNMEYTNINEHVADAIASIYAGLNTEQFKTALSLIKQPLQSKRRKV